MSDAMSDALKPSFWDQFFDLNDAAIKKDETLMAKIKSYCLHQKIESSNPKYRQSLKIEIMALLYKLENPYYEYMFKGKDNEWRWPSDWYFDKLIEN